MHPRILQEPVVVMQQIKNFLKDSFTFTDAHGGQFATMKNNFKLIGRSMSINLYDGSQLLLNNRSLMDLEFEIFCGDHQIARISREWAGATQALLGYSRYATSFEPQTTTEQRLAVIAGLIALDLRREKENGSAVSNLLG